MVSLFLDPYAILFHDSLSQHDNSLLQVVTSVCYICILVVHNFLGDYSVVVVLFVLDSFFRMANRVRDQALPVIIPDVYPNEMKTECLSESMSEASSSHDSFYDSLSDLHGETIDGNFPELSAFLSQEEMNKSLDIAREAFSSPHAVDPAKGHVLSPHVKQPDRSFKELKLSNSTTENIRRRENGLNKSGRTSKPEPSNVRGMISPFLTTSPSIIRALQQHKASKHHGKGGCNTLPIPKARTKTSNKDVNAQSDMCQKAANFIEELSAIFRETNKARDRRPNGDSSSPDSGYLSPKKDNTIIINPPVNESETEKQEEEKSIVVTPARFTEDKTEKVENESKNTIEESKHGQTNKSYSPPSAARFVQKLKSQEVAEGSRVRLECKVTGNPIPGVR